MIDTLPQNKMTVTLKELSTLTEQLAQTLKPGGWIFLQGEVGSGKTTFTQKLLQNLAFDTTVNSPSFAILNIYKTQNTSKINTILHLDMYRIRSATELKYLGIEDEFDPHHSIAIFEWANLVTPKEWREFLDQNGCQPPSYILKIELAHVKDSDCRSLTIGFLNNLNFED